MSSIDYEALAKATDPNFNWDAKPIGLAICTDLARAVVAAYREQRRAAGFVEVRADDVDTVVGWIGDDVRYMGYDDLAALDRIRGTTLVPDPLDAPE